MQYLIAGVTQLTQSFTHWRTFVPYIMRLLSQHQAAPAARERHVHTHTMRPIHLLFLLASSLALRFSLKTSAFSGTRGAGTRPDEAEEQKEKIRNIKPCRAHTELASASSCRFQESALNFAFRCISSTISLLVSGLEREMSM